ncbi:DedA family protein [Arsenophonus symbiont of Ornithomya chloropus]|uniref:DedA family protein n=1 Tax=Arsenophonus symbiont of Ornithomya chloropus TaxID=634121 RepID=UPI0032B1BD17
MSKSTIFLSSFLPPASVMLITIISISFPTLNINLIWLAITLGGTTGSIISYYIGYQITQKKICGQFLNRYQLILDNSYKKLIKKGTIILFTSRFIAILRYTIPLAAGILLMKKRKVYITFFLSSGLWAILYILIVNGTFSIIKSKIFL